MKSFHRLWLLGYCIFSFGAAVSDDRVPTAVEIAMEVGLTSGEVVVLVDDVPVFDPGMPLVARASINTALPVNALFGPGENKVLLRFWPKNSGLDNSSELKVRFGYGPAGAFNGTFAEQAYGVLLQIRPDSKEPIGFDVKERVLGQPLLIGHAIKSAIKLLPGNGVEVPIKINVGIALPPKRWQEGQILIKDSKTAAQIVKKLSKMHAAFDKNKMSFSYELQPMLERIAATQGVSVEDLLRTDYAPFVDSSLGFKLKPFDASASKLVLFGDNRLAMLVPSPIVFANKETNEELAPFLAFWRDAKGEWKIMH